MKICILCKSQFDPHNTKPEHILLDCLGGKKTTTQVICSSCNEKSGTTIDNSIGEAVKEIRNLLNLRSGSGDPAPTLKGIALASGRKIDLLPGGVPDDSKVLYVRSKNESGETNLKLGVFTMERLAQFIDQFAKGVGISGDDFIKLLGSKDLQIEIQRIDESVPMNFAFGTDEHILAVSKMCLTLWGATLGNPELHQQSYQQIEKAVYDYINFKIKPKFEIARTDGRIFEKLNLPQGDWGEVFNILYISSNHLGDVRGFFRLYNTFNFYIDLARNSNHLNRSALLISNPESRNWIFEPDFDLGMSFDDLWPQGPADVSLLKAAIGRIMTYSYKKQGEEYRQRIISDAVMDYFPGDGEVIEQKHVNALSAEVADALVAEIYGLNRKITLQGDEVKKRLTALVAQARSKK